MSTSNDCDNTTHDGVLLKEGDPVFFIKIHYHTHTIMLSEPFEGVNRCGFISWMDVSEGPVNWGYSTEEIAKDALRKNNRIMCPKCHLYVGPQ